MKLQGIEWDFCFCAIIASLAFMSFVPMLDNYEPFYDDFDSVIHNPNVRPHLTNISKILTTDFWGADINGPRSNTQWRPITTLTYRLDFINFCPKGSALYSFTPCLVWFRLVDLVLHCLVSVLIYFVSGFVLETGRVASFSAALIFALHPVHIESVNMLYGRADMLCALFTLITCLLASAAVPKELVVTKRIEHHRKVVMRLKKQNPTPAPAPADANSDDSEAPQPAGPVIPPFKARAPEKEMSRISKPLIVLAFGFSILAILSKEVGIAASLFVPLIVWMKTHRIPARIGFVGVALCVSPTIIRKILVTAWVPPFGIIDNPFAFTKPWSLNRILTYGYLHGRYFLFLFYPFTHSPNYGFNSLSDVKVLSDPRNIITFFAYGVIALSSLYVFIRKAWYSLFIIFWGVLVFLPASNILFPVGTCFADRLLYLPSVPFTLMIGVIINNVINFFVSRDIFERMFTKKGLRTRGALKAVGVVGCISLIMSGIAVVELKTIRERLPFWKDPLTMWMKVVEQFPDNAVANHNTAVELIRRGRIVEALPYSKHNMEIYINSKDKRVNERKSSEQALLAYELTTQEVAIVEQLKKMSVQNVTLFADSIVQIIKTGQLEGTLQIGEQKFPANAVGIKIAIWSIMYSHMLSDHPQVEDVMIQAADFIAVQGQLYRDMYNLMRNTVIPYRKDHGLDYTLANQMVDRYLAVLDGMV